MKLLIIIFLLLNFSSHADIIIAYAKDSSEIDQTPSKKQKIEIKKIQKISSAHNINVIFKPIPWKRALVLLKAGKIDGLINASYKTKRAIFAQYPMKDSKLDSTKKLNDGNSYYLFRHINNTKIRWDGEDFLGKGIVGAMKEYAVVDDLRKHVNITIQEEVRHSKLLESLLNYTIDGYAATNAIINNSIKENPRLFKSIIQDPIPIRKKEYYLIFSKVTYKDKSADMEKIWDGLKEYN